jgi:hypothetical protein
MERWRESLNHLRQGINPKKEVHVSTKKVKIKTKRDSKNKLVIRAKERVDIIPKYPILDI